MAIPQKTSDEVLVKCARHCCICRKFRPLHLQIHHIIEQSQGGSDEFDNLIPICMFCHSDVHTITQLTRRFSLDELKMHRDSVYELVSKGRLPASDSMLTNNELDYIVDEIVSKLNSNQATKLNKASIKILYASLVDESEIETQPVLVHPENTPAKDEVSIHVGSQMFVSNVDPSGVPELLEPLLQERLIEKLSQTVYKITYKGIKFCEEEFDMFDKYSLIKCKCLNCSLHFIICTWHPETHTIESITCPECGNKNGNFIKWRETAFGFIFELVPGNANLDM